MLVWVLWWFQPTCIPGTGRVGAPIRAEDLQSARFVHDRSKRYHRLKPITTVVPMVATTLSEGWIFVVEGREAWLRVGARKLVRLAGIGGMVNFVRVPAGLLSHDRDEAFDFLSRKVGRWV